MSRLAIIPARGGSKRIPRKNVRPFQGRPLLAWPIQAALASALFDDIVVSTDDQEIAEVAVRYGATIPLIRPAHLADDHTPTAPVVAHAVASMAAQGHRYEAVICIYPAAVFVTPQDLNRSEPLVLRAGEGRHVASVVRYAHPVQRALRMTDNGTLEPRDPKMIQSRSQDLEPLFHDAGQFYWATPDTWLSECPLLAQVVPYEMPAWRVQDIDDEDDWRRAEIIHRMLQLDNDH